jgi:hypothetical protein
VEIEIWIALVSVTITVGGFLLGLALLLVRLGQLLQRLVSINEHLEQLNGTVATLVKKGQLVAVDVARLQEQNRDR